MIKSCNAYQFCYQFEPYFLWITVTALHHRRNQLAGLTITLCSFMLRLDLFVQKWNLFVPSSKNLIFHPSFYVLVMFSSTNKSKFLMKLMLQTCSYSYFKKKSIHLWEFWSLAVGSMLANFPWKIYCLVILFLLFHLCVVLQFFSFYSFIADFRDSVSTLEKELFCLKVKRDEIVSKMDEKRYWKTLNICMQM